MFQVQIFVSEVGEWYGWGCGGYAGTYDTVAEAKPELKAAKRAGWTTRLVKVAT